LFLKRGILSPPPLFYAVLYFLLPVNFNAENRRGLRREPQRKIKKKKLFSAVLRVNSVALCVKKEN
jgi:hypothetical protein